MTCNINLTDVVRIIILLYDTFT